MSSKWVSSPKEYITRIFKCFTTAVFSLIGYKFMNGNPAPFLGSNVFFYPSKKMVLEAIPLLKDYMENHGYSRKEYSYRRKDCNIFSRKGAAKLYDLLLEMTEGIKEAQEAEIAVHQFSFRRDNGSRHRLVMIIDDEGDRWYIENYPVFDQYHDKAGMLRFLSESEEKNGIII